MESVSTNIYKDIITMNRTYDGQAIKSYFEKLSTARKLEMQKELQEVNHKYSEIEEGNTIQNKKQDSLVEWPGLEGLSAQISESKMNPASMECLHKKKLELSNELRDKLEELNNLQKEEWFLQKEVNKEKEEIEMVTRLLSLIEKELDYTVEIEKKLQRSLKKLSSVSLAKLRSEIQNLETAQPRFIDELKSKKLDLSNAINELTAQDAFFMQQIWMKELRVVNMTNEIKFTKSHVEEVILKTNAEAEKRTKSTDESLSAIAQAKKVSIWTEEVKNILQKNIS